MTHQDLIEIGNRPDISRTRPDLSVLVDSLLQNFSALKAEIQQTVEARQLEVVTAFYLPLLGTVYSVLNYIIIHDDEENRTSDSFLFARTPSRVATKFTFTSLTREMIELFDYCKTIYKDNDRIQFALVEVLRRPEYFGESLEFVNGRVKVNDENEFKLKYQKILDCFPHITTFEALILVYLQTDDELYDSSDQDSAFIKEQSWQYFCIDYIDGVIHDYFRVTTTQPSNETQENSDQLELWRLIDWCSELMNPTNYCREEVTNRPYYIFLSQTPGMQIMPKITFNAERLSSILPLTFQSQSSTTWMSGFSGRLFVPFPTSMPPIMRRNMWNKLLVGMRVYEDQRFDHSVRQSVFEEAEKLLDVDRPSQENIRLLDVAGGKGDFILWLSDRRNNIESSLVDIADEAVAVAKEKGINGKVIDVENELDSVNEYDIVTILFAIQWLSDQALQRVYNALKPGGRLIFNVYPSTKDFAQHYSTVLTAIGFSNIQMVNSELDSNEMPIMIFTEK